MNGGEDVVKGPRRSEVVNSLCLYLSLVSEDLQGLMKGSCLHRQESGNRPRSERMG